MKKIIDKTTVIFTGLVAIGVVAAILIITTYIGMGAGLSLSQVVAGLFHAELQITFILANCILIALLVLNIASDKIFQKLFAPVLICSISMLLGNLYLSTKNILSIFITLFWLLAVIYLYRTKRELNTNSFNKAIEPDRE